MICAVVLAAGRSRRMGVQKLLLPFGGSTVIGHIVREVCASEVDQAYVVVGREGEAIADALEGCPVELVTNPEPGAEMLSSVRCGLRALPPECSAALVVLGDQPGITRDLVNQIIRAYAASDKGVAVPVYEGQRGHPLLLSTKYRERVLSHYDAVGLRGLLQDYPDDVLEVPVSSPAATSDMNYPDDYQRELRRLKRESRAGD